MGGLHIQTSYSQWRMNSPVLNKTLSGNPTGLNSSDILSRDESLPEATKQFVVRFLSPPSPTHKTREEQWLLHTPPPFILSFPFGSLWWKGRLIPWWLEAWSQASRMILMFILHGEWGARVSAGGNFVTGETRLHYSLVKYIGIRIVLLGINLAWNV